MFTPLQIAAHAITAAYYAANTPTLADCDAVLAPRKLICDAMTDNEYVNYYEQGELFTTIKRMCVALTD